MKFSCGCQLESLDWDTIPENCPAVFDLLTKGLTKGVFQLEGSLGRRWCQKVKPHSIRDMADIISLIRPGCLEAVFREDIESGKKYSIADSYVAVRDKILTAEYIHESLEPILKDTYSVPIYQEQIMKICQEFAGFDLKAADSIRKAMGKKNKELMEKQKTLFIDGSIKNGREKVIAEEIFSWIDKFSGYGFNACVTGDTEITRAISNKKGMKLTVGQLYKLVHNRDYAVAQNQLPLRKKLRQYGYGKCLALDSDNRIRPREIKTIHMNGVADVYLVTTSRGNKIKCTINHKFMTPSMEMIPIGDIGIGGEVLIDGGYEHTDYDYSFSDENRGNKFGILDTIGRKNWQTKDGEAAKFAKFKKENTRQGICGICEEIVDKREIHHRDQNRKNNDSSNLIALCISCHKKDDYRMGRTRQWEKGHPYKIAKILSIEYIGKEEVYDIEMDTVEHNWLANGIIVSNSHAISYAVIGYRTAFAKVHFPTFFFKAMLTNADSSLDRLDEVKEVVYEAKLFNVEVTPPSLSRFCNDFETDGDSRIVFGLGHIKGIGAASLKALKLLKGLQSEGDIFKTIFDKANVPKKVEGQKREMGFKRDVVEALIKVGAMDFIDNRRSRMLARYRVLNEMTDRERDFIIQGGYLEASVYDWLPLLEASEIPRPGRIDKLKAYLESLRLIIGDNAKSSLAWEKFHLGMCISGSEVDMYSSPKANTSCRDFLKLRNNNVCAIACYIEDVRAFKDKNGNWMAFLKVRDDTYMLDGVVVFASAYEKVSMLLEAGNIVLVNGRKRDGSLLVNSVEVI